MILKSASYGKKKYLNDNDVVSAWKVLLADTLK
jgi:hypothetical protein